MNTVNIQALKDNLNQIRRTKVSNSKLENKKAEIVQRSELMFQRWKELNQMANELNLALKEAKDLFELQVKL
jgi:hypothetical protein